MSGQPMDSEAGTDALRLELSGPHVAVVTLTRPQKRNAITPELARALEGVVKRTEATPAIRAVVLAAEGPVFCAGGDLATIAAGGAMDLRTTDGGFAGLVFAPRRKPWIAAIQGPALAGGTEIALACDILVGCPEACFGLPEVKRGLIAGAGGIFRLPRRIPRGLALELIATGDPLPAEAALRCGLLNRIVPQSEVLECCTDLARRIAENAPVAVIESLDVARAADELPEAALIGAARAAVDRVLATDDSREGPRAFVEKRRPIWTGQ